MPRARRGSRGSKTTLSELLGLLTADLSTRTYQTQRKKMEHFEKSSAPTIIRVSRRDIMLFEIALQAILVRNRFRLL